MTQYLNNIISKMLFDTSYLSAPGTSDGVTIQALVRQPGYCLVPLCTSTPKLHFCFCRASDNGFSCIILFANL